MSNLVKNSVDAMEYSPTKEIRIHVYNKDSNCHLEFEDTGSGIEYDNITRVFDPFYTTKEVGKGTGLGLTVTKGIVEENNGTIDVLSEKNKGTRFHLIFNGINHKMEN
ncbi:MAG: GHKL domain-containing protein [Bacteroidales bacterium]|nr:GHKL domain-containing protein [Bacteroidales bacterium]